ncbi:hypothetical protein [Microcoleus sp. bin38.metabat.b11b12b14.051]|nr:hypothetical protein [Microcoleus sp. bin38.metabat.b11b12b14.051]
MARNLQQRAIELPDRKLGWPDRRGPPIDIWYLAESHLTEVQVEIWHF